MSRHRDIRNMDYSDEYDGYDDVYGHSVDDDFYISPSNRQFLYNRENSARTSEGDIKEEDEVEAQLSDSDKAKLESCLTLIKTTLGPIAISHNDLVNIIVTQKFNVEEVLNIILESPQVKQIETTERKDKDVTYHCKNLLIPKLNGFINDESYAKDEGHIKGFSIPKISNFNINLQNKTPPKTSNFIIPKLNAIKGDKDSFTLTNLPLSKIESKTNIDNSCEFSSLSELVSSHLNTAPIKPELNVFPKKMHNPERTTQITQIDISETSNELANLHLSDSQSLDSVGYKNSPLKDWHIDLSIALKTTNSLPSISDKNYVTKLEKFDIPFVDCEEQVLPKNRKLLACKFDIRDILSIHLTNTKCKSRFAKALCKNYKRPKPVLSTSDTFNLSMLRMFNFNIPSPDDIISSHIKW